jgi:tRNA-dihydrouridine synthase A
MLNRTISVAPMMGYTDRHARYFLRLISKHALLYTEMVTTGALLNGDRDWLLRYHPAEHPLALQLGGSDPAELAECSRIATDAGFDEINLNVGCPSDRVQSGRFGACLMAEPALVAECVAAMRAATDVPVTVKCRIGIDDMESYDQFEHFVETVADAGCDTFIVHARKAWLQGLSPKQNRKVPPLKYDYVYRLKHEHQRLSIVLNGGVCSMDQARRHLVHVDGVMIGREAYHNPYILAGADELYGDTCSAKTREEIAWHYMEYIDEQIAQGSQAQQMTRHVLGLFKNRPGSRQWKRHLSERAHTAEAGSYTVAEALEYMPVVNVE